MALISMGEAAVPLPLVVPGEVARLPPFFPGPGALVKVGFGEALGAGAPGDLSRDGGWPLQVVFSLNPRLSQLLLPDWFQSLPSFLHRLQSSEEPCVPPAWASHVRA